MATAINALTTTADKLAIASYDSGGYNVGNYLAAGDGTTQDGAAINDAIEAAGPGGRVIFAPGGTYLIDRAMNPNLTGSGLNINQTWVGYGATIKRMDEVKSVVTSASGTVSVSDTTCTVTSSTGFIVGTNVAFYNVGGDYAGTQRITVINGTDITFSPAVDTEVTGATMITAFSMARTSLSGQVIEGLTFDGNRANNTSFAKWDVQSSIFINGDRAIARYCYIHDEVGEGIIVGGNDTTVDTNVLERIGGNGIHLTGPYANNVKVRGNNIKWVNLGGASVGHNDGGITLSNQIMDTNISGNYIEGALWAFGSIDRVNNMSVNITGNIVRNCEDVLEVAGYAASPSSVAVTNTNLTASMTNGLITVTIAQTGIVAALGYTWTSATAAPYNTKIRITGCIEPEYNGVFPVDSTPDADTVTYLISNNGVLPTTPATAPAVGDITATGLDGNSGYVTFSGNICGNSGRVLVSHGGTFDATYGPGTVTVTDNVMTNCYAKILNAHKVNLKGNVWRYDDDEGLAITSASRLLGVIQIQNSTDINVDDYVEGGAYGVYVTGTSCRSIQISGQMRNQNKWGIHFTSLPTSGDNNIGVKNAAISCDTEASTYIDTQRYAGVKTAGGAYVMNCVFDVQYGQTNSFKGGAILVDGSGLTTLIKDNQIRGAATVCMLVYNNSSVDNIVLDGNCVGDVTRPRMFPVNAGTGYANTDTMDVVGGTLQTGGAAAQITVAQSSGGVITTATLTTPGDYLVLPSNPVSTTNTSGGGDNAATFNIPYEVGTRTII